jgi:hypothetical protein
LDLKRSGAAEFYKFITGGRRCLKPKPPPSRALAPAGKIFSAARKAAGRLDSAGAVWFRKLLLLHPGARKQESGIPGGHFSV